ncbi:hypothetical protein OIU79_010774 [Salix purpurea]|uniref:Uncharacterized protein n=1 Tax=Salix purpurea TaxID=77065 RepID=A0A9Q0TA19_SALPP|nr:hypothetical protein OIU79_010774 [Salix purpurea]
MIIAKENNGGDNDDDQTLTRLFPEGLLLCLVHLTISLEGIDRIHKWRSAFFLSFPTLCRERASFAR